MFTRGSVGHSYGWDEPAPQFQPMSSTLLTHRGEPVLLPVKRPLNAPGFDPTMQWGLVVYPQQHIHRWRFPYGAGPALNLSGPLDR